MRTSVTSLNESVRLRLKAIFDSTGAANPSVGQLISSVTAACEAQFVLKVA
jgi:hypothetical protein